MTRRAILRAAAAALTLAFIAPAHADQNTLVATNFQTIEQFRANWNRLLDKVAKASNVEHSCQNGLCKWGWQLRPGVWAELSESNDHSNRAWYCFRAGSDTTWDCYGNTLDKWVYDPGTAVAEAAPDVTTPDSTVPTPAPSTTPTQGVDSVPIMATPHGNFITIKLGTVGVTMLIDTGASMSAVTPTIASQLIAAGQAEYTSEQGNFILADGSVHSESIINIHSLTIGSHTVTNVQASVGPEGATLLLGLPVLNSIGKFTTDSANNMLVFG